MYPIRPSQAPSDGPYWPDRRPCSECGSTPSVAGGSCCASCSTGGPCDDTKARALSLCSDAPSAQIAVDIGFGRGTAYVYDRGPRMGLAIAGETAEGEQIAAYIEVDRALYARAVIAAQESGLVAQLGAYLASKGHALTLGSVDLGRPILAR